MLILIFLKRSRFVITIDLSHIISGFGNAISRYAPVRKHSFSDLEALEI